MTYVCRRRAPKGESPVTQEGVYWSVAFEIIDEDARAALEKKGKEVLELKVDDSATGKSTSPAPAVGTSTAAGGASFNEPPGLREGGAKGEDRSTTTQQVGGELRGLAGGSGGEVGDVVGGEAVGGDDDDVD